MALGVIGILPLTNYGCSRGVTKPVAVAPEDQQVLGAAAEALIPGEGTGGADAGWAIEFVSTRWKEKPEEMAAWKRIAGRLQTEAMKGGTSFPALAVPQREAVIRAIHPVLIDDPKLSPADKEERECLRTLMRAYFTSAHAPTNQRPPRGEPRAPLTYEHAVAVSLFRSRARATSTGTGDYRRAWAIAGFEGALPGVCKAAESYTQKPKG